MKTFSMLNTGLARLVAFAAVALTAVGCAPAPEEEEAEGTTESAIGEEGVSLSASAAAPEAAVVGAGFTEIARGYVTQIKNFPTYNNPTGGLIKVHVQGCRLSTLQLSVLDSNSYPVYDLRAAGAVTNFDGTYDMYWALGGRNLGYASLYAWAVGSCYATVYQSDTGFTPPPPPPPPPVSCGAQLTEVACRSVPGCVPQYRAVLVPAFPVSYWVNQFAACTRAF